jgi:hypothetical protein
MATLAFPWNEPSTNIRVEQGLQPGSPNAKGRTCGS